MDWREGFHQALKEWFTKNHKYGVVAEYPIEEVISVDEHIIEPHSCCGGAEVETDVYYRTGTKTYRTVTYYGSLSKLMEEL